MATKTITIDLAAYEKLRRARLRPDESFSQVIRRGRWERPRSTGSALLEALERAPPVDEDVLERLERNQAADLPPGDAWTDSRSTPHS
jgi:predicted CopG family antitoxin